jgi:V8-like Glu-specific endopeptidase
MPRSQSEIFKLLKLNGRFEPKWCSPPPGKDDYGKHAIFEQPFISRFFDADVVLMEVNWLTTFDARSLDSDGSYFGVDYDGFLRIVFPNWDGLQEDAKALARKLLPEWEVGNTYLDRDQTSALTKKLEGSLGLQKKIWLAPKGGGSENVEPIGPARAMVRQLQPAHVSAMVDILANHAAGSFDTPQEFFKDLVEASCLPRVWTQEFAGGFQGDPQRDARRLVAWAINRGLNPDDPRYTALGAVLNALLLQKLSPDDARTVAAIVVGYGLIRDNNLLYDIRIRYRVPVAPLAPPGAQINYGPDFVWRGPADIDLQSLISPPLDWQDVGFLMRAMSCASSVCRVEVGPTRGTGFLVAPALALTNYHVLKPEPTDDIEANARSAVLRFGCITSSRGEASKGQEFKLAPEPIIERSCVGEFDFVLLKVEEKILAEKAIQPTPLASDLPAKGTALNILHHPGGNTMKLSTSENGVTGIYEERGLVQYVTSAIDGSSGSPCFDDNWEVVALHHAQRSRSWGSVREGILIHSILQRIQQYL